MTPCPARHVTVTDLGMADSRLPPTAPQLQVPWPFLSLASADHMLMTEGLSPLLGGGG